MPTLTNRWAVLALLFFARAAMTMQFQSIPPIIPFLSEDLDINYTQVGLLIGLFMFPGAFLALPGGILSTRFGDKRIVMAGLLLMTLGAVLFALSPSFPIAFTARLLGGVGVVLLNVQLTKIATDWFSGKEIATAMGILQASWPFGVAIAFTSFGSIATLFSWRTAIHITAAYSALALVLVGLFYRDRTVKSPCVGQRRPPLWVISRREFGLVVLAGTAYVLINAGLVVFLSFTPSLLISGGHTPVWAGLVVALVTWTMIGSLPLGGWLTDKTGWVNPFIAGGVLVCALVMWLLPFGGPVLVWMIMIGLAYGAAPGGMLALPGEVLRQESRATGFGVFYTVYYLGLPFFPPIAGYLHDISGGATAPVLFGGLLMALVPIPLLAFRLLQRRWTPAGQPVPETGP